MGAERWRAEKEWRGAEAGEKSKNNINEIKEIMNSK
jgi:hypothetical protein